MTAAVSAERRPAGQGLRPFDGRKDLAALADLIEMTFSDHLDPGGVQMIQGMRLLSRGGWLGWVLSRWLLPPAANPLGFVWEEHGRLVGNASLMPVSGYDWRWVMANVAVEPGMRRRGIAAELVGAAIESARRAGARQIILQVDSKNEGAQALYKRFGFQTLSERTTWTRPRGKAHSPRITLQEGDRCNASDWRGQYDLARRLHPEGLIWPFPTTPAMFRRLGPDRWFSGGESQHWVLNEQGQITGSLSFRRGLDSGVVRCVLLVDPPSNGLAAAGLLERAFRDRFSLSKTYLLDYPVGVAVKVLSELGFNTRRDLVWMGLDLKPINPSSETRR